MTEEFKKIDELNRTEKTAIILQALQKEGYNDNQSSKLLDVTRSRICAVNKKIKQGTLHPLVNKAKKSIKLLVEGKAVGDMQKVLGSDVLGACKMVLDRTDPVVVKTENTNLSLSYDIKDEDRDKYKKALGIVDAVYETLPEPKQITSLPDLHEKSDARTD
jgi:transcriptional regulator